MQRLHKLLIAAGILITLLNCAIVWFAVDYVSSHALPVHESDSYPLIFPFYKGMSDESFTEVQLYQRVNHYGLRSLLNASVVIPPETRYGYYFEDLNTGSWIGINEKTVFQPVSLLKLPLIAATFKQLSDGVIFSNTTVTILPEDVDDGYGPLASRGHGYSLSVHELIYYVSIHSDNTALQTLRRIVGDDAYYDAALAMGISGTTFNNGLASEVFTLSPKEYSNLFRSLYYSTYLDRDSSQTLLALLSSTNYTRGLPAGVPSGIVVSHKTGLFDTDWHYEFHDCGIVYYPRSPYMLCIMTAGMPYDDSNRFIANLSAITYQYVDAAQLTS